MTCKMPSGSADHSAETEGPGTHMHLLSTLIRHSFFPMVTKSPCAMVDVKTFVEVFLLITNKNGDCQGNDVLVAIYRLDKVNGLPIIHNEFIFNRTDLVQKYSQVPMSLMVITLPKTPISFYGFRMYLYITSI